MSVETGYTCLGNASREQPFHTLDIVQFTMAAGALLAGLNTPIAAQLHLAGGNIIPYHPPLL